MRTTILALAASALVGTVAGSPTARSGGDLAPLITPPAPPSDRVTIQGGGGADPEGHVVKDSYIVVFKDGTPDRHVLKHKVQVQELWAQHATGLQKRGLRWDRLFRGLKHHFSIAGFQGYSAHLPESLLTHIRGLPEVAYVERDTIVSIDLPHVGEPFDAPTTLPAITAEAALSTFDVEKSAPWGLARISHRPRLNFGTFNVYPYDHDGGAGVDVYVIDTGVNIDHVELEGRAKWGKTIPQDADTDSNGHGSHVAGTIASRAYGVAKNASVIAVKVLGAGGSGTMSDVLAGVTWAAESAAAKAKTESDKKDSKHKGSVANMSLGGGKSPSLDRAVDAAVETGLHFAVAAGNDNRDACTFSPAAAPNPVTVGASTIQDERAYFSNHGKCVDVFAPGLNIKSIWNTGNESVNTISGTSMASPHTAGIMAYFLSLYPEKLDVQSVLGDEFADEAQASASWSRFSTGGQLVFDRLRSAAGFPRTEAVTAQGSALSPKQLKKLVVKLASKDILQDLPAETINALIFNNATTAK